MKVKSENNPAADIKAYSVKAGKTLGNVCEVLRKEISKAMPKNTGRIFYAAPVWLMDENPVVGYFVSKKGHVTLLFWSGQSFKTPGLEPEGKFKAAQVKYESASEIDKKLLGKWLKESKKIMWNYRDIRKNKGKMELL